MRILPRLHQTVDPLGDSARRLRTPNLLALDDFLNAYVLTASSEAALDAAMRLKCAVQRRLVALPDEAIDGAARLALQELSRVA